MTKEPRSSPFGPVSWHQRLPGNRGARLRFRRAGDAARDARDWSSAIAAYKHHLAQDPGDAAIWIQYGHVLKEFGQLEHGLEAYERSDRLKPADADLAMHIDDLRRRLEADASEPEGVDDTDQAGTNRVRRKKHDHLRERRHVVTGMDVADLDRLRQRLLSRDPSMRDRKQE